MKDSTIRFLAIVGIIVVIGVVVFTISHIKRNEPTLKTDSPYTQDKPINPNGCGEGVTDCKG